MDGAIEFNERGEYVSAFCRPELGPMRPCQLTEDERMRLPPPWAYKDHDELLYVTTSDHRSVEGRIVPVGTRCLASRKNGVVQLRVVESSPEHVVVLDGSRWVVAAEGAPVIHPSECPELFLPA